MSSIASKHTGSTVPQSTPTVAPVDRPSRRRAGVSYPPSTSRILHVCTPHPAFRVPITHTRTHWGRDPFTRPASAPATIKARTACFQSICTVRTHDTLSHTHHATCPSARRSQLPRKEKPPKPKKKPRPRFALDALPRRAAQFVCAAPRGSAAHTSATRGPWITVTATGLGLDSRSPASVSSGTPAYHNLLNACRSSVPGLARARERPMYGIGMSYVCIGPPPCAQSIYI
ncbi:hypothetical protein C8Q70DRAFT_738361 [Cubamyces menziesii]|nr:hypothetical protein C8Q70DRAFT_738361 [Cubamyces menziesii]